MVLGSVLVLPVLNSMFRSGLVDTLVTHANIKEFEPTPLSGDHRGYMPPLLKTKQSKPNMISTYLYLIVFQSIFSSVNPSTFRFFSSGILGNLIRPKYVAMCPKGKSEKTKELCLGHVGNVVLGLRS